MIKLMHYLWLVLVAASMWSCGTNPKTKEAMTTTNDTLGTFGYDYTFLKKHQPDLVLLKDTATGGMVVLSTAYQGRVMTSSVNGLEGHSNGWINYKLIESGKATKHINAYGGEERLWLGPEGGQFSIYFAPGVKQEFENWQVPAILDTLPFKVDSASQTEALFSADATFSNYSGTVFTVRIERKVSLLSVNDMEEIIGDKLGDSLKAVAYQSENSIKNNGQSSWTKQTGMLSVWMLSMLTPSPDVVIFIPYKEGDDKSLGKIVTDDYFGKVPDERLKVDNGFIYLKADGKFRSKIGISPKRATEWAASYDAGRHALTLLHCSKPDGNSAYVNSKWEIQKEPFSGDAINAYNDGPVADGTQMGPFYELESSSPAASLEPGRQLTHKQSIIHIEGPEKQLNDIVQKLFGLQLKNIQNAFNN